MQEWANFITQKFQSVELCFSDTDSFLFKAIVPNLTEKFRELAYKMDFSNLPV